VDLEVDSMKSAANAAKHGMDFVEAQRLWDDPALLVAPARVEGEPRFIAVGRIGGRHWSTVFTLRAGSVRLISVRRARQGEIVAYENAGV